MKRELVFVLGQARLPVVTYTDPDWELFEPMFRIMADAVLDAGGTVTMISYEQRESSW